MTRRDYVNSVKMIVPAGSQRSRTYQYKVWQRRYLLSPSSKFTYRLIRKAEIEREERDGVSVDQLYNTGQERSEASKVIWRQAI